MGIFGEKYSKEAYEEAECDSKINVHLERSGLYGRESIQSFYDRQAKNREEARNRLEKLYAKGQKEALELNKEHDRLEVRVQEALKELETFEREKLGMRQEEEEETDFSKL